ncbi:MAG: PEP-CTERM sorting domain-containing protein [Fimbriimonadaceae bacterium]|nr:MAG: PEP-CTERM sorting domain-containing protein [Fimbriimonadaceae bacterium]
MKKIAFASLTLGMVALSATASASYSFTGAIINEDFDSLPNSVDSAGLFTALNQVAIPGSTGFVGGRIGGTGSSMNFVVSGGAATSGALYSYGTGNATERALGALASGSNVGGFGFELINNSGANITSITLSFTAEFWRSSTVVTNVLTAFYGFNGGSANSSNFLSDAGMTAFTGWDITGPAFVASSNGALDGNDPANQALVAATLTLQTPLANGSSMFFAWRDTNDAGNDAGLAMDNLSIRATTDAVPEPATMAVLAAAGLAAAARRKRK